MREAEPETIDRIARLLTAAIDAKRGRRTDRAITRLFERVTRTPEGVNNAFFAVQKLRDFGSIDEAETAFLFNEILEHRRTWDHNRGKKEPGFDEAVLSGVELELILAASEANDRTDAIAFHRSRGETDLADLIANDGDAYRTMCAEGQIALLNREVSDDDAEQAALRSAALSQVRPRATPGAPIAELIMRLATAEPGREMLLALGAVTDAIAGAEPAAAVASIQGLRDVGGISWEDSTLLIDAALSTVLDIALARDREWRRLERAIDLYDNAHGTVYDGVIQDEDRPLEWQVLHVLKNRRLDGIRAWTLRQFGEHRMANMLLNKPDELNDIILQAFFR